MHDCTQIYEPGQPDQHKLSEHGPNSSRWLLCMCLGMEVFRARGRYTTGARRHNGGAA